MKSVLSLFSFSCDGQIQSLHYEKLRQWGFGRLLSEVNSVPDCAVKAALSEVWRCPQVEVIVIQSRFYEVICCWDLKLPVS